jgi:hypothetical protein
MEETKIAKYGFYISIGALFISVMALIRDYFDFKEDPMTFWNYWIENSKTPYIMVSLLAFTVGIWFQRKFGKMNKNKTFTDLEKIVNPKILVAYCDEKIFGSDYKILMNTQISKNIIKLSDVTIKDLKDNLTSNKFDIVNLGIPVSQNGDIMIGSYFLSSKELISLLEISQTKLLILGSCNSVYLASNTVRKVNMIAATSNLRAEEYENWLSVFFKLLSEDLPLSKSFDLSKSINKDLPITMILNQDLIFEKQK